LATGRAFGYSSRCRGFAAARWSLAGQVRRGLTKVNKPCIPRRRLSAAWQRGFLASAHPVQARTRRDARQHRVCRWTSGGLERLPWRRRKPLRPGPRCVGLSNGSSSDTGHSGGQASMRAVLAQLDRLCPESRVQARTPSEFKSTPALTLTLP